MTPEELKAIRDEAMRCAVRGSEWMSQAERHCEDLLRYVDELHEIIKVSATVAADEIERLRAGLAASKDTAANYLDEIDRLNKVGGSDINPECEGCAELAALKPRLATLERQQSAQDALAGYGIDAKGALADVCREMAGRALKAEAELAACKENQERWFEAEANFYGLPWKGDRQSSVQALAAELAALREAATSQASPAPAPRSAAPGT